LRTRWHFPSFISIRAPPPWWSSFWRQQHHEKSDSGDMDGDFVSLICSLMQYRFAAFFYELRVKKYDNVASVAQLFRSSCRWKTMKVGWKWRLDAIKANTIWYLIFDINFALFMGSKGWTVSFYASGNVWLPWICFLYSSLSGVLYGSKPRNPQNHPTIVLFERSLRWLSSTMSGAHLDDIFRAIFKFFDEHDTGKVQRYCYFDRAAVLLLFYMKAIWGYISCFCVALNDPIQHYVIYCRSATGCEWCLFPKSLRLAYLAHSIASQSWKYITISRT